MIGSLAKPGDVLAEQGPFATEAEALQECAAMDREYDRVEGMH